MAMNELLNVAVDRAADLYESPPTEELVRIGHDHVGPAALQDSLRGSAALLIGSVSRGRTGLMWIL